MALKLVICKISKLVISPLKTSWPWYNRQFKTNKQTNYIARFPPECAKTTTMAIMTTKIQLKSESKFCWEKLKIRGLSLTWTALDESFLRCLIAHSVSVVGLFGGLATREKRLLKDDKELIISGLPFFLLIFLVKFIISNSFLGFSCDTIVLLIFEGSSTSEVWFDSSDGESLSSTSSLSDRSSSSSQESIFALWPVNKEASESLRFILWPHNSHFKIIFLTLL